MTYPPPWFPPPWFPSDWAGWSYPDPWHPSSRDFPENARERALAPCIKCGAPINAGCVNKRGVRVGNHRVRIRDRMAARRYARVIGDGPEGD